MHVITNAVAFKVAWVSTVFGGANELPFLGPMVVLAVVALHLWLVAEPRRELTLILLAGCIGLAWDSVMVTAGWVSYPSGTVVAGLAPYWIIAMWMLFATTLNVTFRRLQGNLWLAALLGLVFGPLSYYAGSSAGAINLLEPLAAYVALGGAWALAFPGLLVLAKQLDGTGSEPIQNRIGL